MEALPENRVEKEPEEFDAIVVLGKNWRAYPKLDEQIHLSMESKMSALGAAEAIKSGLSDKIILSGGKTAGDSFPSEAGAMRDFILEKYPELSENLVLEEISMDTHENAEEVARIIEKLHIKTAALMTVDYHLDRAEQTFQNHGLQVSPLSSESFLKNRNPHYEELVRRFSQSNRVTLEKAKEWLLRMWLKVDTRGAINKKIVSKIRG